MTQVNLSTCCQGCAWLRRIRVTLYIVEEVGQIKDYIEHIKNTTSNLKDTNDLNVILEKYEDDMKKHKKDGQIKIYRIK